MYERYVQGTEGELAVILDPALSGSPLESAYSGQLGGLLSVVVTNGIPAPGQVMDVFSNVEKTQNFGQVRGLGLGNGLRLELIHARSDLMLIATQSLQRLSLTSSVEGEFGFQFDGDAERPFEFQGSTNLIQWETILSTNTPTGVIRLADPDRANYPHRFYRVFYP